jgi:hypothetical protein
LKLLAPGLKLKLLAPGLRPLIVLGGEIERGIDGERREESEKLSNRSLAPFLNQMSFTAFYSPLLSIIWSLYIAGLEVENLLGTCWKLLGSHFRGFLRLGLSNDHGRSGRELGIRLLSRFYLYEYIISEIKSRKGGW